MTWQFFTTVLFFVALDLYRRHRQACRLMTRHAELSERLAKATEGLRDQQLTFMKIVYSRWDDEDRELLKNSTPGTVEAPPSPEQQRVQLDQGPGA